MPGGPLWKLAWWGRLLPCLEKDEDSSARQAMTHLNQVGQCIRWHFTNNNNSNGSVVNKVKSWFGNSNNNASDAPQIESTLARLIIQDNADTGKPEIFIVPSDNSVGYKLNISLSRVDRVLADPATGIIILYAKSIDRQQAKELLKFALLEPIPVTGDEVQIPVDDRNLAVHHLQVLSEWERQRRIANDDDDLEDEDENQPNFLQARAQKAKHFAQREMEMQQTRRDRETRKAKLVAASGGMKYTALAMANK